MHVLVSLLLSKHENVTKNSPKKINMYILCLIKEGNDGGYTWHIVQKPKLDKYFKIDNFSKEFI